MGVNHKQREIVSKSIVKYIHGEIDSFQLDDLLFTSDSSDDPTANYLSSSMWAFYCDMDRHFNNGKYALESEHVELIMKWVALLDRHAEIEKSELKRHKKRLFDFEIQE
jgi:hypothetical protein